MIALNMIMNAEDAIDRYCDGLSELFDEMYWDGGFNNSRALAYIERCALDDGYVIEGDDLEDALYEAYEICEKGLS